MIDFDLEQLIERARRGEPIGERDVSMHFDGLTYDILFQLMLVKPIEATAAARNAAERAQGP